MWGNNCKVDATRSLQRIRMYALVTLNAKNAKGRFIDTKYVDVSVRQLTTIIACFFYE